MFSMKGKYVKGEDLSNVCRMITDTRTIDNSHDILNRLEQIRILTHLNLIDKDQAEYMISIVTSKTQAGEEVI